MASDFEAVVTRAAEDAGLDPAFVTRLVKAESNWNPSAVSPKGAVGLMQIMPETGKRYGVTNLTDPTQNVRAGIAYLSDLQKKYPGRPDLVAAAYNAGEGAVDKAGGVPKFAETQGYVEKVDPFAKYATPSSATASQTAKEDDPFAKYVGATPPPTAAQMLANVPIDEAGNPIKAEPYHPGLNESPTMARVKGFIAGVTGAQPGLKPALEAAAGKDQRTLEPSQLAGLAIPGAPEVSGAIRGAIDVAPTVARAGIGYALGGIHGAEAALVSGPIWRWIKGGVQAVQEAKATAEAAGSSATKVLQAIKDADTTMQAQFFKSAVNRVAAGEDAAKVIKEYAGKTAATTAEIKAGEAPAAAAPPVPAHLTPKDVIPLPDSVPRLQTVVEGLPQIAPPPPPNVAPPIAPASIPAAWKPYAGQTELGQVLPAQPPGRTMSGAPQASRPFVPPATRPPQSPAGAVNMAMKETGLRIPARVMDAAIRRVKAGEDAVDVVKSYAEAK